MARKLSYLLVSGLLAMLGVLVTASPAWAHAQLLATSPADGQVLTRAPARVTLTFDERVFEITHSIQVYAPDGARVDTGPTRYGARAPEITVALRPGLAQGTYTVSYRVVSDDSHPVQGTFTFSIGAPSGTVVNPATLGLHPGPLVGVVFGVVRWLGFCCFALLIGGVAFVIWCWPAGASRRPVLRLTMGAWGGLALSVLSALLLQGVYGAGQGVGHVFWPDVLHATLYSQYGRALGVRMLLVVVALFVFTIILGSLPAEGRRERVTAGAVWGVLTAALAATWAVADHAGTGAQVALAVPADVIHLSAMAVWLGGLIVLVTVVLRNSGHPAGRPQAGGPATRRQAGRRRQAATAEAVAAVTGFSPIALGCVAVILATGTYQAWRNVGSLGALAGTTYGRLLLVKIAGMLALIALGYLARRRIASGLRAPAADRQAVEAVPVARVRAGATARSGHGKASSRTGNGRAGNGGATSGGAGNGEGGNPADPDRVTVTLARLRWSVTAEVLIAATVLAVTAVLVNTPTGRESYRPPARAAARAGGSPQQWHARSAFASPYRSAT